MKIILPLLLLLGLSTANVNAQFDNEAAATVQDLFAVESNSNDFLPVEEAYRLLVTPQAGKLLLQWDIADGYYLYRSRFAAALNNGKESVPLTLQLPQGKQKHDEYFGDVEVFYQQVTAELPLPAGSEKFQVQITSQGCADAGLCYPPYTQNFQVDVAARSVLPLRKADVGQPPPVKPTSKESAQAAAAPTSFWLMALFAFLGGAILNLMPCVFPVLALKVMGLVQANAESSAQRRLHGLTYTAGVLVSFLLVAGLLLALRSAGAALGWGFQLQSPWVVACLIYLFFILGLSLSGFIEFSGRWVGAGQGLTEKSGALGSFFTGVLAVIVASPCTAPFMGAAMGFALVQPAPVGLAVFLALGLGMAAPFLLLVSVPALARLLPKPGAWMNTFKEILAFPLYATAVWLLWVIGRQTGANGMAAVLIGCLLLVLALWLWRLGKIPLRAGAVAAGGLALFILASPLLNSAASQGVTDATAYSPERVLDQRADGKPVFVNVTADWCITCIANERVALSSQAVKDAFASNDVAYLKGDWTNSAPQITALLAQYGRSGVPLYLLFPADPSAPAIVLPQLLTPGIVVDALNSLSTADSSPKLTSSR
ncbi:MAG: protein-disulfide reductase DsbD family protein [Pseudomonadales bacterium]